MHITEISKRYGVSLRAIRYYEAKGLLALERDERGIRLFDDENHHKLVLILSLKRIGLSIKEIKCILSDESNNHMTIIEEAHARLTRELNEQFEMHRMLSKVLYQYDDQNLLAIIDDLLVMPKKLERMSNMDKQITVNISEDLVPLVYRTQGGLVDAIAELRRSFNTERGAEIPPIRLKDEKDLNALTMSIEIDSQVVNVKLEDADQDQMIHDIVIHVKSAILKASV